MGVRKRAILTPYLKVNGTINRTKITVKRHCSDHPNIKQDNAKYCSQCGKEIISVDVPVVEKLDAMDVLRKHKDYRDDILHQPEYCDAILPNKSMPQQLDVFDDSNQDQSFDVNLLGRSQFIGLQVEWLMTECATEIQILEEAFGKDKVEINWGLVSYWS